MPGGTTCRMIVYKLNTLTMSRMPRKLERAITQMLASTTSCCDVKFCDERRLVDFCRKPIHKQSKKDLKFNEKKM